MKRTLSALAVACLILVGPARGDEPKKPVKVPFELLKSQHMVVEVKINGEGPFRLIFDTGAPVTLINNKVAKAASVIPKDFKRPFFTMFGSLGEFKVKSLQVGDASAEDVPVMVMDHPTVEAISKLAGPIDGLVGLSFWGRFRLSVDYQAKEMTFTPTTYRPPDLMQNVMAMLVAGGGQPKKHVLAPAGQWGFRVAKEAGDKEPGVVVQAVLAGSPAAAAGLKEGDRLLVLDTRWTDSVTDCYAAAVRVRPGHEARLRIKRDGKEMDLTVKVVAGL
jgi:PDZ domain-containing protein/aspartyl protease